MTGFVRCFFFSSLSSLLISNRERLDSFWTESSSSPMHVHIYPSSESTTITATTATTTTTTMSSTTARMESLTINIHDIVQNIELCAVSTQCAPCTSRRTIASKWWQYTGQGWRRRHTENCMHTNAPSTVLFGNVHCAPFLCSRAFVLLLLLPPRTANPLNAKHRRRRRRCLCWLVCCGFEIDLMALPFASAVYRCYFSELYSCRRFHSHSHSHSHSCARYSFTSFWVLSMLFLRCCCCCFSRFCLVAGSRIRACVLLYECIRHWDAMDCSICTPLDDGRIE